MDTFVSDPNHAFSCSILRRCCIARLDKKNEGPWKISDR